MHSIIYLLFSASLLSTVEVPKPPIMLVGRSGMPRECGDHPIFACTVFREVSLSCICELADDGWRVRARVRAVPRVYTSSLAYITHELQHISDFQSMLREHVSTIAGKRFAQPGACNDFAGATMSSFPATMKRIAHVSTERRDGRTEAGQ